MQAYENCLGATSTRHAPWYVVPADEKKNARLIISHIVLETMNALKMRFPKANHERRRELQAFRERLTTSS